MNTENQNQEQNQNPDKTLKNYEAAMSKLTAVLGGKENILPTKKVSKDVVTNLVGTLLKERKEKLAESIKTSLAELLEKHVALTKAIKEKEKELEKLKQDKMKEFTEAANKVFQQVEGIDQIEKDYIEAIKLASGNNS